MALLLSKMRHLQRMLINVDMLITVLCCIGVSMSRASQQRAFTVVG